MTSIFTKISVFKCQYYKYEINSDIDVKNRKYEKLKIYGDDLRNSYIEILKNYIKELEKKIVRFMKKSVIDRFMLSYKANDIFYDENEIKDILNKVINIKYNLEKITVNQFVRDFLFCEMYYIEKYNLSFPIFNLKKNGNDNSVNSLNSSMVSNICI